MVTDEDCRRSMGNVAQVDRVGWGTQAGILGQQAQQYQGPAPPCAHLLVGKAHQHIASDGPERFWWQCTQCDQKFVPSGTGAVSNSKY